MGEGPRAHKRIMIVITGRKLSGMENREEIWNAARGNYHASANQRLSAAYREGSVFGNVTKKTFGGKGEPILSNQSEVTWG